MAEASPTCAGCPFYQGKNECQLPTDKPKQSVKSAREHYRLYFKRPCERVASGATRAKSERADIGSPGVTS